MIDFLVRQKPAKRRKPSFIPSRLVNRVWEAVSSLFTMLFRALAGLFSRFFDLLRTNPLVPKVIGLSVLFLFIAGAAFLVFFAIFSPEMPPGNLVATLNDVSAYYLTPENSQSQVAVLSSEEDWAIISAFDGQEIGAGSQIQDRSLDIEYPVRPGETLSEIAYAYHIPYDFLAWYNKISNANRIRVGTVIIIPSLDNIKKTEGEYAQHKQQ